MGKIRVLVIDDSALMRRILSELLSDDPAIEVVGTASDPYIARRKIKDLNPQVLTLDVEMPRMDGLTFLRNLMRLHPLPVVMVSSMTESGADETLEALELGAIDFVAKPRADVARRMEDYRDEIVAKVKAAAAVSVQVLDARSKPVLPKFAVDEVVPDKAARRRMRSTDRVVAVGASTGGTEAIKRVLSNMPPDAPGMVITQHIPASFSGPFAARMNRHSAMAVKEAEDGDVVLRGHAYIAPGDRHLTLGRDGARYVCRLSDGPPVNRHRPSVDVLFRSVAQSAGFNAVGVLLTGMGADGAQGLGEMQEAGAATLAQDEASSVVWGMPGEAARRGAADQVIPLRRIPARIIELAASDSVEHA